MPGLKRRGAGGIVCGMRRNFPEIVGCAVAAVFSSLIALAAASAPQYHLPLDGDAVWAGRDAARARPAVVYGAAKWTEGVSGKGLDVSRWAYDQTTALVADALPGVSTRRGAVAFWFRPHWEKGDGEKHVVFSARSPAWRPLRIYFVKGKDGRLDVSFVEKHQVQFLLGEFFEKDVWTHVALSWDARDGSVSLYRDGAPVGRKVDPGAFDVPEETTDLLLQCGDGTDRFNACVGDGVYDDIRLYDEPLSEAKAFLLADGSAATAMRPLASPPSGTFSLAHRDAFLAGTAPLLRFRSSGGATFTLRATGTSRGLSLDGATDGAVAPAVTSADTLDLRVGCTLEFAPRGRALAFLLDGAEQGRLVLDRDVGRIVSMEVADGVTVADRRGETPHVPAPASAAESRLWSLPGSAGFQPATAAGKMPALPGGVREAVCLNAYWRVWPVDDYLGAPPEGVAPGYVRVPGSFRSPLWNIHRLDPATGEPDAGAQSWRGRPLDSYRAAWYEREVAPPPEWKRGGGRVWLVFDHFNADAGRVWWNGELVTSFRQDFKSFSAVPHRVRIDVTDRLAPNGRNALRLYADRHYSGLWQGRPAIGDHAEICLGDVWLEKTPSRLVIASAVALPSWRRKSVTLRVRIANGGAERGKVAVRAVFSRPEGRKVCRTTAELTGAPEQVVVWTEPWPDPVPWSADDPQLYELNVAIGRGGAVADTFPAQRFGFREAWAEDGRLFLNGQPLRLRMWTSPSFDRLRYWWGHPEAVGQFVAHVKELGYDTVRNAPWRKGSIVGQSAYYDECDRAGLYLLNQMPTYEDEPRDLYDPEVERFLEAWGSHPSILMWYTDFNTCSYAWNQDPAKLADASYDPPRKRLVRARARTAESVMRALDPSRECFQHAGGCSGRIFGSMNYQSYGTPLQEQEDWPAQWAKGHTQPLMVVESAFPYPDQFRRFDIKGGDKEHLGAEHAARYFGPSVFAAERFPAPHSAPLLWNSDVASGRDPNMTRLSDLHYRRVVRAWRAYGVDAIGDFPCGRDHAYSVQMFPNQRVVWRVGGDPKTPGLKPENADGISETQRHPLGDYSRPDGLHGTVRECFAPLLVFAAGDPDVFTNKDHSFYAGERFRKSLVVVNDHSFPVEIDYSWRCGGDSGAGAVRVEAGGIAREPIALVAPEVAEKTDAKLEIEWRVRDGGGSQRGGGLQSALEIHDNGGLETAAPLPAGRDTIALRFFPRNPSSPREPREPRNPRDPSSPRKPSAPRNPSLPLSLYDPLGKTAAVLRRAGVDFTRVASLDGLPAGTRLIVGQGAFADAPLEGDLPPEVADAIVFEQPTNALARFVMAAPSLRDAFANIPNSPLLAGLDDADLHDWRGASDTVPAFVLSDEYSPHYPRSKWKCGNGGIVAGCVIRRPSRGAFQTVVSCGFNLEDAALLVERRPGGGRTIWCQMDVTSRYGRDPAATRLVDNLLASFQNGLPGSAGFQPAKVEAVSRPPRDGEGAVATSARRDAAPPRASNVASAGKMPALPGGDVFYLGSAADAKTLALAGASLPAWDGASRGTVLVLPGANLSWLPFAYLRKKVLDFRAYVPDDPVFAGISAADLYFRNANDLPSPAFDVRREGDTTFVFLGLAPDGSVKGLWNDEKILRVWSAVLANLGVPLAPDSPYIPGIDLYDGDAFHNW